MAFARFPGCNVSREVEQVASESGHVRFLQFRLERDSGQQDKGDTADTCNESGADSQRVICSKSKVNWGDAV